MPGQPRFEVSQLLRSDGAGDGRMAHALRTHARRTRSSGRPRRCSGWWQP
jgi:hypothetical protein